MGRRDNFRFSLFDLFSLFVWVALVLSWIELYNWLSTVETASITRITAELHDVDGTPTCALFEERVIWSADGTFTRVRYSRRLISFTLLAVLTVAFVFYRRIRAQQRRANAQNGENSTAQ